MMMVYLVRQSCRLTHDSERQRLFITESFQMTADARPLDLPLPQVIRKPEHRHTRPEHTDTQWVSLHTCTCHNCAILQGEVPKYYWQSFNLFNVHMTVYILISKLMNFSCKHRFLAVSVRKCECFSVCTCVWRPPGVFWAAAVLSLWWWGWSGRLSPG